MIFSEPQTIDELVALKMEYGETGLILAGGTDLIPLLKRRNHPSRHLINIKRIPEFRDISYDKEKGIRIGPAVTLREMIDDPLISGSYPLLTKAALSVGFNHLRNMGTLGGNICLDTKCTYYNQSAFWWKSRSDCFKRGGETCYVVRGGKGCFAFSAADTVSALIALEAELIIRGPEQERRTPLEAFFTGDGRRPLKLEGDEVITAVLIPPPAQGWREGFSKKSPRGSVDFSIATLSIRLKNNGRGFEDVRIALNGVSTRPIRANEAERYLIGKGLNDETIKEALRLLIKGATPLSLIGASAFVRRNMIGVMFADLIETIT
jgi:4-hydroxybenzoyl-CoA reductase subunit beta